MNINNVYQNVDVRRSIKEGKLYVLFQWSDEDEIFREAYVKRMMIISEQIRLKMNFCNSIQRNMRSAVKFLSAQKQIYNQNLQLKLPVCQPIFYTNLLSPFVLLC